ncbi:hypothetical protein WISP_30047 [Willisornis vidua]|uniref:Uncharacterized protein n=1 Tax=Willisornis vidua TaxID=1566151 RepID=A0ABQ9DKE8_9PASS|nr:hypothetical protein WISP_30047 [Willisornis vidua]
MKQESGTGSMPVGRQLFASEIREVNAGMISNADTWDKAVQLDKQRAQAVPNARQDSKDATQEMEQKALSPITSADSSAPPFLEANPNKGACPKSIVPKVSFTSDIEKDDDKDDSFDLGWLEKAQVVPQLNQNVWVNLANATGQDTIYLFTVTPIDPFWTCLKQMADRNGVNSSLKPACIPTSSYKEP